MKLFAYLFSFFVLVLLIFFPTPADAKQVCEDAVQNKIAWNHTGNTKWLPQNIQGLCDEVKSAEPAICFRKTMHGLYPDNRRTSSNGAPPDLSMKMSRGLPRPDGKMWKWAEAVQLCKGVTSAEKTISCYQTETSISGKNPKIVKMCNARGKAKTAPTLEYDTDNIALPHPNEPRFEIDPNGGLDPADIQIGNSGDDGDTEAAPGVPEVVWMDPGVGIRLWGELQRQYLIGRGKYDITGATSDVGMLGYAEGGQKSAGVLDRQWARTFIIGKQDEKRVVFVNVDQGQLFLSVTQGVLEKLRARYGDLYTEDNLVISATHTHGGAGGHSNYNLYNQSIIGVEGVILQGALGRPVRVEQTYQAVVEGIYQSIVMAHDDVSAGQIYINSGDINGANKNRSLPAFNRNPEARDGTMPAEDKEMTVLKFVKGDREIGMLSWFATHGVSLPASNRLLTSDNKGYAQYYVEELKSAELRDPEYVAAFAQSSAGDMTPNINLDGTRPETRDAIESAKIVGRLQAAKALELANSASRPVSGSVDFKHQYIDFSNQTVAGRFTDGRTRQTCYPILGASFAAGAEDGRGPLYSEGRTLDLSTKILATAADVVGLDEFTDLVDCQGEKDSFLPFIIGENGDPFETPHVIPISILKVGQLGMLAVPAEFTIVAGHRVEQTVLDVEGTGLQKTVIAGFANAYAGYVTTKEEYDVQHYEGASTHFGPWTLAAYQQAFDTLARALAEDAAPGFSVREPRPKTFSNHKDRFPVSEIRDTPPQFNDRGGSSCNQIFNPCKYGQMIRQVKSSYNWGQTVEFEFWGSSLRHDLKTMSSYFKVQGRSGSGWETVATDNDWHTKLVWEKGLVHDVLELGLLPTESTITIKWHIPDRTSEGEYKIVFYGKYNEGSGVEEYSVTSKTFTVNARRRR